jgi:DNA adenine methylase
MMYLGGKTRVSKPIAEILLAAKGGRRQYVEPFVGGAAVAALVSPSFPDVLLMDSHLDLVQMWQAVALDGWIPPEDLSEPEYLALRTMAPSALRAFAGFPCSFGGKWFGGYARDPRPGSTRNYAATASRSIVRRAAGFQHAEILWGDYRDAEAFVDHEAVVYLDPPYAGTTGYAGVDAFDSAAFWDTAERWCAREALVFVSEYVAPAGWIPVWEADVKGSLNGRGAVTPVHERLYALPSTIAAAGLSA